MVYKLHHHFRNMFDLLFDTLCCVNIHLLPHIDIDIIGYLYLTLHTHLSFMKMFIFGLSHKLSLQKAKAFKEFRHSFIRK